MPRIGALFALMLGAAVGAALAQPTETVTLWNCKDKDGRTVLTSLKEDTVGKDCRIVQQQRVTVMPAGKAAGTKSPAGFPKESASDRLTARAKQRETIERELNQEQSMLADARRKLAEQEATRGGNEKNYARVLERLKPYQDTVEVHQKNVEALKRELGNLSR